MPRVPRKLAFVAAPIAVLALGAASYGSVVGFAAASRSPSQAAEPASSASDPADSTTPEQADANEPNEATPPGDGHADTDAIDADTQQEGVN